MAPGDHPQHHAADLDHSGHDLAGRDHAGHDHPDEEAECEEALTELYTFLDGELTEQKRIEIKAHLDDCSPCLEVYDFEAELRLVIRQRCSDQVPPSLRERVARQLAALDRPGSQPSPPGP